MMEPTSDMDMEFRCTRRQIARGSRPDAETSDKLFLIKKVSVLRATYQVRLLAYRAQKEGKKLVLRLPKGAEEHSTLRAFRDECGSLVRIERT